ncbi:hypothetical protein PHPALM_20625 [Phytophthora palmivora]|uniref:Uncharacterized protein n=1 Tax=Phytophthora palmivora TaxID=4796 RepID=A0A2P4XED8_9STRA|nr:hypothetical protein PHPALM_20625 [Phytophthora palmivora]
MNESQQSDRLTEERCEVPDDVFKSSKKQTIVALKRKMEAFETQMASIRARLEARREFESFDRNSHLPTVNSSPQSTSVHTETSVERLKFPLLRRIEHTKVANAAPKDPFLEVENVLHRTITRDIYVRDAEIVTTKEVAAASVTKDAQQLGEEARKRMVAYTQNESGWRFDERTSRYQQVMEVKQQAEKAQQEADRQRETAQQMKALLRDPYEELRTPPVPRNVLTPIASSPTTSFLLKKEHEWVWILASLSTKLTFTPRDETSDMVLDNEKELSMYVVYYIAASEVNSKDVQTKEQWLDALNSDCPPTNGWMCCSGHGVPPAPELTSIKSGIQTWTVAGAGTGHLNGKYVACGVHDGVRRFKSSGGVELFRKSVPVASALSQVLHGRDATRPESNSSRTNDELGGNDNREKKNKPSVVLPTGLAAIEKDELDFRSMQRVGSWLTMNESKERNRRMLASRSASDESTRVPDTPGYAMIDGNSVMNQDSREASDAGDVAVSRHENGCCLGAVLDDEWSSKRGELMNHQ